MFEPDVDLEGKRKRVAVEYHSGSRTFTLPAGAYVLEARYGDASVDHAFEVGVGEERSETVLLGAGQLRVVPLRAGSPLAKGVSYRVYAGPADVEGKRERVAVKHHAGTHVFTLPAGEYTLEAEHGDRIGQTAFELAVGERQELEIDLP